MHVSHVHGSRVARVFFSLIVNDNWSISSLLPTPPDPQNPLKALFELRRLKRTNRWTA